MNIHDAIDEYLGSKQNSITHTTYDWYAHFLHLFDNWCKEVGIADLSQVTAPYVQQFVKASPTDSTYTKHHRAQIVKGFLHWCAQDDDLGIKEKTVKRIELPLVEQTEVEIFTEEEIKKLFHACERLRHPHRNKAILHILLDTGIRVGELGLDRRRPNEETGLRMENLFLGRDDSFIRVMGKGRKIRTVGLGQETSQAVRRYLNRERGRSECSHVFVARADEPMSVRMVQDTLASLGELAGVEDCHAHRFRHTFAVNQLLNGTSDLVLMKLMGHSTLDSTKTYVRAMSQIQARKAAKSVVDSMRNKKGR